MRIERFVSPRTADSWVCVGHNTPIFYSVSLFIHSVIVLIVTILINVFEANEPGNDYGEGTGWSVMIPAPAATFIWAIVSILLCVYGNLWPMFVIVSYIIVGLALIALGILSILLYDWHTIAWLPGMFMFFLAFHCFFFAWSGISAFRRKKNGKIESLDRKNSA
ncbi:hypothetical protein ABW19_dt0210533 [Dactylella cylindrospora]|nr:hypothetical protein ABW19_dt0210533 [Dactylella cylindrospora]